MSDTSSQNSRERRNNAHSIDTKKLAEMSAHDRVIAAYKIAASRQSRVASASFRSQSTRDGYTRHHHLPEHLKSPQMKRKEQLEAEREDRIRTECHIENQSSLRDYIELARSDNGGLSPEARPLTPSAWTKDRTSRTEFMYNWRTLPEAHRSSRQAETPGPGAYTSDLFFIGL